jgi:hypothetical protein
MQEFSWSVYIKYKAHNIAQHSWNKTANFYIYYLGSIRAFTNFTAIGLCSLLFVFAVTLSVEYEDYSLWKAPNKGAGVRRSGSALAIHVAFI